MMAPGGGTDIRNEAKDVTVASDGPAVAVAVVSSSSFLKRHGRTYETQVGIRRLTLRCTCLV
jgi:hypothetical protein|eukprot:SAG25_NODE_186_length_12406_cov_7.083530_4_plen_62_part_00